ncbi:hypothetical protein CBR_g36308 [Chara braunii]|uniref:Retrotransposon gag domain-containing protein n=1 Tax=Chara braunii TaxID=69332 RepID=A0A388LKH4_CHABU|nr:hypothetical protein CBR_g36308 [Chara braunii]|eukprot:GBG82777.1 hypothetical protein CBR_g36308 [Chara braunii]
MRSFLMNPPKWIRSEFVREELNSLAQLYGLKVDWPQRTRSSSLATLNKTQATVPADGTAATPTPAPAIPVDASKDSKDASHANDSTDPSKDASKAAKDASGGKDPKQSTNELEKRERLFTRETVIGDEAAHWVEVTSAGGAPETEKGLSSLAQVSHDLVATCALQQQEILHLQQTVDQMLARLQALEKQRAAVATAGPSTLTTRVQVLEDDVSNIKRVHQDFRTSQQATNLQLETQVQAAATVTPASASSRRPPKLDDIPVFCDQSKTEPIPWWRQFTFMLDMHHVPNNDRHPCLYHRSGGACQAWLDNILTSHGVAVSELHTKLTWQELTDAWHKRFQVDPPDLQAMDKLNKLHQNTLLSQDWITEFQRLASTPDLPLAFRAIKHLFIMRLCPALQNVLTQIAETLDTSNKLFSTASRIILTNIEARNAADLPQ